MALRNLVLIVNPKAGTRDKAGLQAAIELLQKHIPIEVVLTEKPGHATQIAQTRGGDPDTLITTCGGDGTILEALNGLPPQGVLGILPGGTANVIARELGVPLSLREAAKVLLSGATKRLDVGRVAFHHPNEDPEGPFSREVRYLMVAGFGFDAYVAGRVPALPKKVLGQYAYHLETMKQYFFYQPPNMTVTIDGGQSLHGQFALLANMRRYGGGLFFAQDANHQDGLLDLVLFEKLSVRTLVKGAWEALQRRGVPRNLAHRCRGAVYDFSFDRPTPFQLDGEVFPGIRRARVSVQPGGVTVVTP